MSKNNIAWKDKLIVALQENWLVALRLNKHIRPRNNYDITAASVHEITDKTVTIKYKRFYVWPVLIKLSFSDFEQIKVYLKRKKHLNDMEILDLNKKRSKVRRNELYKTALMKWITIALIFAVVIGLSVMIALLVKR